jgi:hypothetical protein
VDTLGGRKVLQILKQGNPQLALPCIHAITNLSTNGNLLHITIVIIYYLFVYSYYSNVIIAASIEFRNSGHFLHFV